MPSEKLDQLTVLNKDASLDGISVKQQADGRGSALRVDSDTTTAPAVLVQGSGDLLDLRDAAGVSQFSVSNAGNLTFSGTTTATGDQTVTGTFTVNGATVLNEAGAATGDTRIEGDTDANLVFVDASTDRVGIGTATPSTKLEVTGVATVTQGSVINESGADSDTRIEGDTDVNLVFVDASTDRVGIGTATPSTKFEVTGVTTVTQGAVINESGADSDTRIEGDTNVNLVFVDASTDRVGIGTATPGNLLDVSGGSLAISTAGQGLKVAEGANATMGTLVLTGATPVVVSTTAVTANSRIFLTTNVPGGVPAFFWVSARTAGTSFSVTGTAGDTSTVAWLIVEPA